LTETWQEREHKILAFYIGEDTVVEETEEVNYRKESYVLVCTF
jgi:hypothetical protein